MNSKKVYEGPDSLTSAREWVMENVATERIPCPCCGEQLKVYTYKLSAGMAYVLYAMFKEAGTGWVNVPSLGRKLVEKKIIDQPFGGYYAKLQFWDLIEQNHKTAGEWRLTGRGLRFVNGLISVPPRVSVLLNNLFGGDPFLSEDKSDWINIRHAFGDKFDYEEMMKESYEQL